MTDTQTILVTCVAKLAFFAFAFSDAVWAEAERPRVDLASEPIVRPAQRAHGCQEGLVPQVRVDSGHPWRPPFGIDRVGALPMVEVQFPPGQPPRGDYFVATYRDGQELERKSLDFKQNPAPGTVRGTQSPFFSTVQIASIPTEVVLLMQCAPDRQVEQLLRHRVEWPTLEADARARPDRQINPVDLGAILVPHDWLLIAGGQSAIIDVAAIVRTSALPQARLRAWFDGGKPSEMAIALEPNQRLTKQLRLPIAVRRDTATMLHISLMDDGRELWSKKIRTMVVAKPLRLPVFGAIETKLRYDAPVAVGHAKAGEQTVSLDYSTLWDPKQNDVVVAMPNGSRFVFWRGANYIPIWAGQYNTGFTHEWAEAIYLQAKNAEGGYEMPEPLNDKELRYGSVRIIESTPSRIHIRWTYQSTDINYKVWGDQSVEDYYFYPDGFGTRVVSLKAPPNVAYETSEFIVLTPQAAFPFEVLPSRAVEVVYLDGDTSSISFPVPQDDPLTPKIVTKVPGQLNKPALYRIFQERRDVEPVIEFSPSSHSPAFAFGGFYDRGQLVTPTYWGDHWPLSRGKLTRYYIHDGIYSSPAHNPLISWANNKPTPLFIAESLTLDTLGQVRNMQDRRWVWLIAKTDMPNEELRAWAESFSSPPSVSVKGARIATPSYSQERRSIRLVAESNSIEVHVKPSTYTVNPVFELEDASETIDRVSIDDKSLTAADYAWDGATLWVKTKIGARGAKLGVQFH